MYPILKGLRIVEASAFIAAPMGGLTLSQLGADVIRCDPIGGGVDNGRWPLTAEGKSLYWASLNKGKRSVTLNMREAEGRELLAALVTADDPNGGLFLTNLPARGPLTYEALKAKRADVVMLQITGHADGTTALDYTVNSAVGIPFATGDARPDKPVNNMLPAWDVITGVTAATGLLAADRQRRETGEGRFIGLALSDVAYATVGHLGHIAEAQINGTERAAHGNELYGAFGRDFRTSDGRHVMVVAITPRQWQSLLEATETVEHMVHVAQMLGVDFADEGARYESRDILNPLFQRWIGRHTFAEVRDAFDAKGVCWGPYQSFLQMVAEDPRCSAESELFDEVEQPGIGRYLMPGSSLRFEGVAREPVRPAAGLGEHTEQVLGDVLGLSDAVIGDLRERGVVGG